MSYQFTMREHFRFSEYMKSNGIKYATKFDYLAGLQSFVIGE